MFPKKPLVGVLSAVWAALSFGSYMEPFDGGDANWIYGYGGTYIPGTTDWYENGGNPGGYISGLASNLYAVWTTDTAVYGDMSGLALSVDTKIDNSVSGDAQLYVGRDGVYYVGPTWGVAADTAWTTHSYPLTTNNFTHWSSSSSGTLDYVLAAPDDIGLFFGGRLAGGAGYVMVDNFGTEAIPEPAVMGLVLLVAVAALAGNRIFRPKNATTMSRHRLSHFSPPVPPNPSRQI